MFLFGYCILSRAARTDGPSLTEVRNGLRNARLTARIERLEQHAGIGEPLKLTIAFFDSILDGTISDEEFARYAGALSAIIPPPDLCSTPAEESKPSQ